jgi:molecular chaperone GrpE
MGKMGFMKKKSTEDMNMDEKIEADDSLVNETASENEKSFEAISPEENGEDAEELPNLEVLPEIDVAAIIAERDSSKDQLLRVRADFDNYRKRVARDDARHRKMAAEAVVRDLLPVLDNLDLALAHAGDNSGGLTQGVEMIRKQFYEALTRHGLEVIPAEGRAFDPNVHEAITCIPSEDVAADHVIQEFQKGYRLGDFVLRPAKVVVSSGSAAKVCETEQNVLDSATGTTNNDIEEQQ